MLVLLVGAAVLLFLGLIYAYSVLLAPLKAAFGWDVSGMTLVFALSIIAFTVGCLVSGEIERRGHARRGLVLGAALLLAGFVGTSAVGGGASLGAACASYGLVASLGIGIGRELPLALGVDDMTAAFVIGFVNIGSGLGRLGGGAVLDRLGRGRTMCGIAAVGTVAPLVMVASLVLGSVAVQVVACLLTGIGWGAAVVSMPYVTRTEWGQRNMAENMAVVNTYSIPGSMVGSWGAGLLSTLVGSYVPTLLVMCAMGAVSVVVALRMRAGVPVMRLGENPDL